MIISNDAEKAFDKLQYPLVVKKKITQDSRNRRELSQSDKKYFQKHTHKLIANILNAERLNTLPIRAERG